MPLAILHEDNHLLGVLKPAGLLSQGDHTGDPSVVDVAKVYLKERYAKPGNVFLGLVHRLDRPVSGVMVLARTSKAASRLAAQFRDGTVDKRYLAIVRGRLPLPRGELAAHLAATGDTHGVTRAARSGFPGSRPALLRYRVLDQARDVTLIEIELLTGRRHQIRAQFALEGCPVRGDVKYGAAATADGQLALHAQRLEFAHPVGGKPVVLQAPPPWCWPPADTTAEL